jgi:hypothetical protein
MISSGTKLRAKQMVDWKASAYAEARKLATNSNDGLGNLGRLIAVFPDVGIVADCRP